METDAPRGNRTAEQTGSEEKERVESSAENRAQEGADTWLSRSLGDAVFNSDLAAAERQPVPTKNHTLDSLLKREKSPDLVPHPGFKDNRGKYLYCVALSSEGMSFGRIGIQGNEVYTICHKELCAVVHDCAAEPYQSEDNEVVKEWIRIHQSVVDAAWERFGTVLPSGFDTIIWAREDGGGPERALKDWMENSYQSLAEKLRRFAGKAEYGVQVCWDPKAIGHEIIQTNDEMKRLDKEIRSKPKGIAYMYKQKLEDVLKKAMEKEADRCFKDIYERIRRCVDDIRVEKTKKVEEGRQMLMNVSCLADKHKSEKLGEELEKINAWKGFSVRFTGPWPPYSFVAYG